MNLRLVFLYGLLIIFSGLICYDHADRIIYGVTDDLYHSYIMLQYKSGSITTAELFKIYLFEPLRQQRPLSGLFIGVHTVLGQSSIFMFYFLKFFYIVGFLFSFRLVLKRELKSENIVFIILLLSQIYPIAAGFYYSVIMWQMYWVFMLYFLHIYFLYSERLSAYILSGALFLLTILFNEYTAFFLPFVLYHIYFRMPKKNRLKKIIVAVVIPIIIAIVYRYYLVELIYGNMFKMENAVSKQSLSNFILYIVQTLKLFIVEIPILIINSVKNIVYYTWIDWLTVVLAVAMVAAIYRMKELSKLYIITKKDQLAVVAFFFLSFSFCAITSYKPILTGFNTRIFVMGIIIYPFLVLILVYAIKNISIRKFMISAIIMLSTITIISQKNAWIFSSEQTSTINNNFIQKNIDFSEIKNIIITDGSGDHDKEVISESYSFLPHPYTHKLDLKDFSVSVINLFNTQQKVGPLTYRSLYVNYQFNKDGMLEVNNAIIKYPFYFYNVPFNTVDKISNKEEMEMAIQQMIKRHKND